MYVWVMFIEPLPSVLDLLEKDPDPLTLNLTNKSLLSRDSVPLLQAIQSQLSLTSINLSGNKLKDDAMPRLQIALGELPSLQHLDLSSTGISHQVYRLAVLQMVIFFHVVFCE